MHQQTTIANLLVSYSWGCFQRAKSEILRVLMAFDDPTPHVNKSDVMGIAIVGTCLDSRDVIRRCHTLWMDQPLDSFAFAVKWVPVDHWCATDLDTIKTLIDEEVAPQIGEHQTWGMKVYKRRWKKYHTNEIVEYLATGIDRKVDLGHPDRILWIDVLGRETAVSLLRSGEVFSLGLPHP